MSCRAVMRTGRAGGRTDRHIRPKVRQYPTAWIGQGSTLGYIFSSYFNNFCGHHLWVIFRILTISLWSWKIQHISIPHVNLLGLWMKSVNSLVPGRHKQLWSGSATDKLCCVMLPRFWLFWTTFTIRNFSKIPLKRGLSTWITHMSSAIGS